MILKTQSLTPALLRVIRDKGTETAFTGEYDEWDRPGSFLCRQCGLALFRSQTKFHSGCGWASFDETIKNAVISVPDADGMRIENLCSRCKAHLGHVFKGEGFTPQNTRYCINSLSLDFVSDLQVNDSEEAIVAGGCFWGVEYYFSKMPGVLKTEVGYIGGSKINPTYETVCMGNTGHVEAMRVVYDPAKTSFEEIIKLFLQIHDPSQINGQGPDIGEQYRSVIFYYDSMQEEISRRLLKQLESQQYTIATQLRPMNTFWRAEDYHQHYYSKTGKQPYCHHYVKRFAE